MTAMAVIATISAVAAESPLWMRYPAISPDGKRIAFTYKGDIYTVPSAGGHATRLTTNPAHETRPVWSPDGSLIAFASDRFGTMDVFVMPATGGEATRLTTNSVAEYPETFMGNDAVLFTSSVMPDARDSQFPSGQFPQIYKVSTKGGRPELFSSLAMESLALSPDGTRLLYHDMKGYEDKWRKHHTSSITRDVWVADLTSPRKFTRLTTFKGEDRNPVWSTDGTSYYYLSEADGSFNVYRGSLTGANPEKLTSFTTHPVRFLSTSKDGRLSFGYDGELYTLTPGGQPQKVAVEILNDVEEIPERAQTLTSGARSLAVSPDGKEVAFVARGDVYVASVEYGTTRQITDTPTQERNVDFAPDGRSLVYSAERDGSWGVYMASLVRPEDKHFAYATEIREEPLVADGTTSFQPQFSPDGKEVAYLADRTELRVINLDSRKTRTVLPAEYNYSYSDGDQTYTWSPDSRWFLATYLDRGGWNNQDIVLVKADGSGEMYNLTQSGYSDGNPQWVLGGKAMTWASDRAGYRSHGSWGAEADTYIMFFDGDEYDRFRLSKEERELLEESKKKDTPADDESTKDKSGKKDKKGADADKKKDEVKPLKFDLDNRKDRVIRLTSTSSHLGDSYLTKKGDKLYWTAPFESGYDLWVTDLVEGSTKIHIKGLGASGMTADKDGDNLYVVARGGMKKVGLKDGKTSPINYKAPFMWRPSEERAYIFDHAWRQVKDKFYDKDIHGIDWQGYHDAYARFLPHINNGYDFQELLSEMLGELNGSHTGARFYGNSCTYDGEPAVAALGAFFDPSYAGDGLKVVEVLKGGPLAKSDSRIAAGSVITAIDGAPVKAGEDYYPLLSRKVGKNTRLQVTNPDGTTFEQEVKPIGAGTQSNLMYKRWVERNRARVDSLSGGRVGYIHVKGMNSESFRETYSDLLGLYRNRDAVIIDTRHNGGGWLHEDLAILLSGEKFAEFVPRGQYIGQDPFNRWTKPSCVLMCEDNYSNAHGFPWTYKELGIGKLIGAPVPGTMTAVWWETQIDPEYVFGIPMVGMADNQGRILENLQLEPDIEVYNTPESQLAGEDTQLERAVIEMLSQADAAKQKAAK